MKGRTRCTRACPVGEHVHYASSGWDGAWYTLEHSSRPRTDNYAAWLERVAAASRLQRLFPRLRRPEW